MPARRTDQPPRRIRLQPPLVLPPVPDAVLWPQHPAPALVVEHSQISYRDAKGTRRQGSGPTLIDQIPVSDLGFSEWIDRHAREYAARERVESNRLKGPQHASHHIPKLHSIRRPSRFLFTFQTK